jgi:hypothetical protein
MNTTTHPSTEETTPAKVKKNVVCVCCLTFFPLLYVVGVTIKGLL